MPTRAWPNASRRCASRSQHTDTDDAGQFRQSRRLPTTQPPRTTATLLLAPSLAVAVLALSRACIVTDRRVDAARAGVPDRPISRVRLARSARSLPHIQARRRGRLQRRRSSRAASRRTGSCARRALGRQCDDQLRGVPKTKALARDRLGFRAKQVARDLGEDGRRASKAGQRGIGYPDLGPMRSRAVGGLQWVLRGQPERNQP
jgi:hypothetical protein